MKYVKILLLSLILLSFNAFALNSPSQIAAMMDSGNLKGAESSLQDVLHSGKDTAKVHYMLAQVYLKEGRLPDARSELARANQMDPEHSYTDNAHYRPIADAIAGRHLSSNNAVGAPVVVMTAAPSGPTDYTFLKVFGSFLVFGLLAWAAIASFLSRKEKQEEQGRLDDAIASLRSGAALLVQDIQKEILAEKTSASPIPAKLTAINAVNFRALNLYERTKNLITADMSDVTRMHDELADINQALSEVLDNDYSGTLTTVKVKKTKSSYQPKAEPVPVSETASVSHSSVASPTQAAPQPVVVNTNNGLSLTDLLVADMVINEPRRHSDDNYFTRPPAPPVAEPDSGNDDRWTAPSSDSGNDDSFSSSSSDSGNDDSWSSSSSDDSSSSSDWGSSSDSSSSSDSGSSDSF